MRAHRRAAILRVLAERAQASDRELAEALDLSRTSVASVRRELVAEGLVAPVPAPPGSHYPVAGWRLHEAPMRCERCPADDALDRAACADGEVA